MRKLYLIVGTIAFFIIFIWGITLFKPRFDENNRLKAELSSAKIKLDDYNKTLTEFQKQFEVHQDLLKQKEHLLSRLYTKDDIIRLLDELLVKSSDYGISITEITPSVEELIALNKAAVDDNQPIHLDIAIKMKSRTINTGRFIKNIESQNYYKGFNFCTISNSDLNNPNSDVYYSFKAILGMIKES